MISNSDSSTHRGRPPKMKPLMVIEYNNGKSGIDRSDQKVSYAITIWKHKVLSQITFTYKNNHSM